MKKSGFRPKKEGKRKEPEKGNDIGTGIPDQQSALRIGFGAQKQSKDHPKKKKKLLSRILAHRLISRHKKGEKREKGEGKRVGTDRRREAWSMKPDEKKTTKLKLSHVRENNDVGGKKRRKKGGNITPGVAKRGNQM